jgi:hypothetical protein
MRVLAAHQPNYLPWLGLFYKVAQADIWVLADDVPYSTGNLINRNRIRTAEGWQWLTVPVHSRGRSGQTIAEVEIVAVDTWARKHWQALCWNYARAPYFKRYAERLEALYSSAWTRLLDLNTALIQFLLDALEIEVDLCYSSELALSQERTQRLVDMALVCQCDVYLAGGGSSRDYLELAAFAEASIECRFVEFAHPVYAQCQPGFVHNMSALDLLFNCGPESGKVLSRGC